MIDPQDLENRFTYHPATDMQGAKYDRIRNEALVMAQRLETLCPDSRELALAITKLEEAVFWANAAIARHS